MPSPTIIDCDPGVDDVLALLLALTSPELDIIAYLPQFGNCDAEDTYNNILKLYGVLHAHLKAHPEDLARFPGIKDKKPLLLRGANGPLSGKGHTAKYFHGSDGLGGITKEYPEITLPSPSQVSHLLSFPSEAESNEPGYKAVLRLLAEQPDNSVTYIALGPLTNLALILREDIELFRRKVCLVSIMGGAIDVPGNTSPVAEFNVYADAYAAHEVFSHAAELPIYLLPLDITVQHMLPFSAYASLVDPAFTSPPQHAGYPESPLVHFTSAFLRHTAVIMAKYGKKGMELHDPLAVYFAMHNASALAGGKKANGSATANGSTGGGSTELAEGWEVRNVEFVVEHKGEYTAGMCVVDRRHSTKMNRSERGKSRAELHEASAVSASESQPKEQEEEEDEDPADVQVDTPEQSHWDHEDGVNVVIRSPGSHALVNDLLTGIWGVKGREA